MEILEIYIEECLDQDQASLHHREVKRLEELQKYLPQNLQKKVNTFIQDFCVSFNFFLCLRYVIGILIYFLHDAIWYILFNSNCNNVSIKKVVYLQ